MFGGMSYRPGLACSQQTCVWMHGNVDVAFTFKREKKMAKPSLFFFFYCLFAPSAALCRAAVDLPLSLPSRYESAHARCHA